MSEYEEWRAEQEEKLDKEAKHQARVAHMSDFDFERYKREEIARAEAAKLRNPPAPKPQPGVVTDDGSLDHLDGAAYDARMRSYGINSNLATLSESVAADSERASNEAFDTAVSKWQRRQPR